MNSAKAAAESQNVLTSFAPAIAVFKVEKSTVLNNIPKMKIPINNPKSPILFMIKAFLAASLNS